jgi:hypothetical protein
MAIEQDFKHHVRWLPPYHFIVGPILLVNLVYAIRVLFRSQDWPSILDALMAVALMLLFLFARRMAITVQDRLIRLEERLRMERLLPADLKGQIEKFSVEQLVALRFASDAELPTLARTVLDKGITEQRDIKAMITTWRADHLRA